MAIRAQEAAFAFHLRVGASDLSETHEACTPRSGYAACEGWKIDRIRQRSFVTRCERCLIDLETLAEQRFVDAVETQLRRPDGERIKIKARQTEPVIGKPIFDLPTVPGLPQRDDAHHLKITMRRWHNAHCFGDVEALLQCMQFARPHEHVIVESRMQGGSGGKTAAAVRAELGGEDERAVAILGNTHMTLPSFGHTDARPHLERRILHADDMAAVGDKIGEIMADAIHDEAGAVGAQLGNEIMAKRPTAHGELKMVRRNRRGCTAASGHVMTITVTAQEHR